MVLCTIVGTWERGSEIYSFFIQQWNKFYKTKTNKEKEQYWFELGLFVILEFSFFDLSFRKKKKANPFCLQTILTSIKK